MLMLLKKYINKNYISILISIIVFLIKIHQPSKQNSYNGRKNGYNFWTKRDH